MNLWIVNQYAIPPSQPGITRDFALAAALRERGHDPTLIAGVPPERGQGRPDRQRRRIPAHRILRKFEHECQVV